MRNKSSNNETQLDLKNFIVRIYDPTTDQGRGFDRLFSVSSANRESYSSLEAVMKYAFGTHVLLNEHERLVCFDKKRIVEWYRANVDESLLDSACYKRFTDNLWKHELTSVKSMAKKTHELESKTSAVDGVNDEFPNEMEHRFFHKKRPYYCVSRAPIDWKDLATFALYGLEQFSDDVSFYLAHFSIDRIKEYCEQRGRLDYERTFTGNLCNKRIKRHGLLLGPDYHLLIHINSKEGQYLKSFWETQCGDNERTIIDDTPTSRNQSSYSVNLPLTLEEEKVDASVKEGTEVKIPCLFSPSDYNCDYINDEEWQDLQFLFQEDQSKELSPVVVPPLPEDDDTKDMFIQGWECAFSPEPINSVDVFSSNKEVVELPLEAELPRKRPCLEVSSLPEDNVEELFQLG